MDKVILITGASSGIGEGIARELGGAGARLLLGARRLERIEAIAAEIRDADGFAEARSLDVTDRTSMAKFVQTAMEKWGCIDVLINNAGVMPLSPLAAGKQDEWERMVDVNVKGVLWGIGAVLPIMEAQEAATSSISVPSVRSRWCRQLLFTAQQNSQSGQSPTDYGRKARTFALPALILASSKANLHRRLPIRKPWPR